MKSEEQEFGAEEVDDNMGDMKAYVAEVPEPYPTDNLDEIIAVSVSSCNINMNPSKDKGNDNDTSDVHNNSISGALLRDFPRSPEPSACGGLLLRDFSESVSVTETDTNTEEAPSSPSHDQQSKRKLRRPASPTPHQATTSQSMGTKGMCVSSYRPSGANLDIAVCLYGPSRVFFAQFTPSHKEDLDQTTTTAEAAVVSDVAPPQDQDQTSSPPKNDHIRDNNDSNDNQKDDTKTNSTNRDAISGDPRWTGKDGFPRLARRYDYGLADIGSLTNKRRIQSTKQPPVLTEQDDIHQEELIREEEEEEEPQQEAHLADNPTSSPSHLSNPTTTVDVDVDVDVYSQQKPPPHIIDLQALRRIASQGISDVGSHRPVAWRVMLGYLPTNTSEWEEKLKSDRLLYRNLVAELFVRPDLDDAGRHKGRNKIVKGTHPTITSAATTTHPAENHEYSNNNGNDNNSSSDEQEEKYDNDEYPDEMVSPITIAEESSSRTTNPLNDAASNKNNKLFTSKTSPVPMAYSPSANQEGYAALIPARIREQWKLDGQEGILHPHVDAHIARRATYCGAKSMCNHSIADGQQHTNTLLVVDDQGYTPDDVTQSKPRISVNDDPLNQQEEDSKWHQFYENAALLDEVRKDVVRTHPDLHFFLEPDENLGQRRYAVLERILFVWAKLNRGVRYVQGMNEIVGTIYYVLANDFNEEWAAEAEADAYFLFNVIVTEMRDVFVPDLDMADTGIQGRISNMMQLLSLHDPEVRCHLDDMGIDPTFYSIRWLTTLLSREFTLPDTIRLWDSMFASTHKENFLRYVCVTMVLMTRDQLLEGDFSICLRLLQSYPPTNVDRMLESSRALWIYESQVTLACHKSGIGLGQALSFLDPPPGVIMAYGLKRGRTESTGKRVERGLLMAKDAAEETASSVALAGRKILGNAAKTMTEWSKKRAEAKEAKKRAEFAAIVRT